MKNTNYHKLNRLQAVLILLSLFFIVFSFLFNYYMRENFISELHQSLAQETALISGNINSYLTQYSAIANQLSHNTQVNDLVKNITDTGVEDVDAFEKVTGILKDIQNTNKPDAFAWIGVNSTNRIIYPDGYVVLHDYYYADRPWYKMMIESPDIVTMSEPYIEIADFIEVVTLTRPLFDGQTIIGNIGMDLSTSKIKEFLSTFKVGKTGQALILTEGGFIISNENIIHSTEVLRPDNPIYALKESIFSGRSKISEITINGEEVYFYSFQTSIDSWYLCSYVPKTEINSRISVVNWMSGILIVSAGIIVLVLMRLMRLGNDHQVLFEMNKQLVDKERILTEKNKEIHITALKFESQKDESEAAYQQLAAADEELRAQYDEIEIYTNQLEKIRVQFELAVSYTSSAVWEFDAQTKEFHILYGFKENNNKDFEAQANGKTYIDKIICPDDREFFWHALNSYIKGESEELYVQVRINNSKGNLEWWLLQGKGDLENTQIVSGILVNINKLKEQEAFIRKLAYMDPLTELPNRRKYRQRLEQALSLNNKGAVLMIDLDNFKEINDTLGHIYGDSLLKEIAKRLQTFESDDIFVSRFGGDEFLILLEGLSENKVIDNIVEDIIERVGQKIEIDDNDNEIKVSVGISKYPDDAQTVDELIMNADVAMYHVKGNGKDHYAFFNREMRAEIHEKTRIEKVIDQTLREDGFKLVIQPKINPNTGLVESGEALIRIKSHDLMPNEFIPVAEMSHRILDIGRWVLEEAVKLLHQWQMDNRVIKAIAVNFSPKQMMDHDFVGFYKTLISKYDINPKYIEFEITESIILGNQEETINFLNELKSLGSEISLDDFGTGYSSLSYLTYMPVDSIKLDKTLCDRFVNNKDINVIKSIVSLAHGLGLKVIAEGI